MVKLTSQFHKFCSFNSTVEPDCCSCNFVCRRCECHVTSTPKLPKRDKSGPFLRYVNIIIRTTVCILCMHCESLAVASFHLADVAVLAYFVPRHCKQAWWLGKRKELGSIPLTFTSTRDTRLFYSTWTEDTGCYNSPLPLHPLISLQALAWTAVHSVSPQSGQR